MMKLLIQYIKNFNIKYFNFPHYTKLNPKDLSIIIANALDYFDTALYGFLAPILAPIFFPEYDPIVQLILTYSTLASSSFTRPIGAFVFGMIARKFGPKTGLSYSLIGMAISSVFMGLLPGFSNMGWVAPLFLIIARMLRGFFAAGESTIAKLYVLEGKTRSDALNISHFYQSAAMLGMVFASIAATLVASFAEYPILWRLCFCIGGLAGITGYFLRCSSLKAQVFADSNAKSNVQPNIQSDESHHDPIENSSNQINYFSSLKILWQQRSNVLRVALVTTFSYITYVVPFVFMNSFVPLVTSITLETMMALNTMLVIFDMVMIPIVGRWLNSFEGAHVMIFASLILACTMIPLFNNLPDASLAYVTGCRIWIVFWGIVFLCPMNLWLKHLFNRQDQYLLVGMGTALGAGTLGRFTPVICLALWRNTEMPMYPALYLAMILLLVALVVRTARRSEQIELQSARTDYC